MRALSDWTAGAVVRAGRVGLGPLVALLVVAAAWLLLDLLGSSGRGGAEVAKHGDPPSDIVRAVVETPAQPGPTPRSSVQVEESESDLKNAGPSFLVEGRVVDPAGNPLAGVGVGVAGDIESSARSDQAGRFVVSCPRKERSVAVIDLQWVGLRPTPIRRGGGTHLLVAARSITVRGRVVDPEGRGLSDARVAVVPAPDALVAGDVIRWEAHALTRDVHLEPDGSFILGHLPALVGARLGTSLDGYLPDVRDLTLEPGEQLIVLEPRGRTVSGRVVTLEGKPAAGAVVILGASETTTGENGDFDLKPRGVVEESDLLAVVRGLQPAVLERFGERLCRSDVSIAGLNLVLGGPALQLEGQVVDGSGAPSRRSFLTIVDPTPVRSRPGTTLEELISPEPSRGSGPRSERDGTFRLGGLLARPYTLRARDKRTGRVVESDPIQAPSSQVVLVYSAVEGDSMLRGRVTLEDGSPAAGLKVKAGEGPGIRLNAVTDASGRFALEGLTAMTVDLVLTGDSVMPLRRRVSAPEFSGEIALQVLGRRHLVIESLQTREAPDAARVLGSDGAPLEILVLGSAESAPGSTLVRFAAGRSELLAVGSQAREVVLYRGGRALGRKTLQLAEGRVALVSWP